MPGSTAASNNDVLLPAHASLPTRRRPSLTSPKSPVDSPPATRPPPPRPPSLSSPPPNPRHKKRQWLAACGTTSPVSKRRPVVSGNNNDNNPAMVPWHIYDDMSKRCDDLEIEYAILQRHLDSKDLRIAELEAALDKTEAAHRDELQTTCDRMERLQTQVDELTRDKSQLTLDLAKAAAMEPQLAQTQHYMEAMHDAMMDMEFEMMRLREESARLLTASSAKSQSNAIQRELRGLKKQRCVSQSRWLCDDDDEEDDYGLDMDLDGDRVRAFRRSEGHEDTHTEDASSGDDWRSSRSSSGAGGGDDGVFHIHEIDFLDLADQVVLYATEKTTAQLELCTALETQLQVDMWQYEKLLVDEASSATRRPLAPESPHALADVDALLIEIHNLLYPTLMQPRRCHVPVDRGVAAAE